MRFRTVLSSYMNHLDCSGAELSAESGLSQAVISRYRSGSRVPPSNSDSIDRLARALARIAARRGIDDVNRETVQEVLLAALREEMGQTDDQVLLPEELAASGRLISALDEFNLDDYFRKVHFDRIVAPQLPFRLPRSKTYTGIDGLKCAQLDFLRTTAFSRNSGDVTMFSDMPIEGLAQDNVFAKQWAFGVALMLKHGLTINMVHDVNRPFAEMMIGLEAWLPLYMTGSVRPYYLEVSPKDTFHHLVWTSGAATLIGNAVRGAFERVNCHFTSEVDEMARDHQVASDMLARAHPLMDVYRAQRCRELLTFLRAGAHTPGARTMLAAVPPLFTASEQTLRSACIAAGIDTSTIEATLATVREFREVKCDSIAHAGPGRSTIEMLVMERDEFEKHRPRFAFASCCLDLNVPYTWELYQQHLRDVRAVAATHPEIVFRETSELPFRNIQILVREDQWVLVSKPANPAINFVIHHPRLRAAIESMALSTDALPDLDSQSTK